MPQALAEGLSILVSHGVVLQVDNFLDTLVVDHTKRDRDEVLLVTLIQESSLCLFQVFLSLYTAYDGFVILEEIGN
jgi:hypothetical protein